MKQSFLKATATALSLGAATTAMAESGWQPYAGVDFPIQRGDTERVVTIPTSEFVKDRGALRYLAPSVEARFKSRPVFSAHVGIRHRTERPNGSYFSFGPELEYTLSSTGTLNIDTNAFLEESANITAGIIYPELQTLSGDLTIGYSQTDLAYDIKRGVFAALSFASENPTITLPSSTRERIPEDHYEIIESGLSALSNSHDYQRLHGIGHDFFEYGQTYDVSGHELTLTFPLEVGRSFEAQNFQALDSFDIYAFVAPGYSVWAADVDGLGMGGCHGPIAEVGAGLRSYFNNGTAANFSVNHRYTAESNCFIGGVNGKASSDTVVKFQIGFEF